MQTQPATIPTFFTFLELLKAGVRNKEKEAAKTIGDIPPDKKKIIEEGGYSGNIQSFDDYINFVLNATYANNAEPEFFWLHLFLGDNEKLLRDLAAEYKIPLKDLYVAMSQKLLADIENNFDAYEKFYKIRFVPDDQIP